MSQSLVSKIRNELEQSGALTTEVNGQETVTAKDGRQYPKNRRKNIEPEADDATLEADETPPDSSTAQPSSLECAEAIERIAAGVFKAAEQAHGEVERIAAGVFRELADPACDVLDSARVFHRLAGAALEGLKAS